MLRLLPFLLLCIPAFAYPQAKVDSLQRALVRTKVDSTKIKILQALFEEYSNDSQTLAEETIVKAIDISQQKGLKKYSADSYNLYGRFLITQSKDDSAIVILNQSLEISQENSYPEQQSDALVNLGYAYWQKGDFEKALDYQRENIELARSMGDSVRVANSYLMMGNVLYQPGELTNAMYYYTLASERFLEFGDLEGYLAAIGNIGFIQRNLKNYESAIKYFKISDSISSVINHIPGKAFANYNISVVYKNTGKLDSALVNNKIGRELYEKLGFQKRVSYCYFTLGEIYRKKEDINEALNAYQTSLNISAQVDDSVQIGYSNMAVADMHSELGNIEKSVEYLDIAAKVAQRMKLDILAMDIHERLAQRQSRYGDFKNAYRNLEKFIVLKDSLYTKEKRDLAEEIEAKYQNDQKSKEIALLASEKEVQALQLNQSNNERNAIIAFAILILLLSSLLYNQYRIKQKANRELLVLNQMKSNFFANISHEFRTPLTLIQGPIEHLEQNPEEKLAASDIKMIRRNTSKVLGLVNQLLDLSRIDEGKLKLKATEGDVFKCLRTAAASFSSHAAQRNMDYRVNVPNEGLWASFDRDKLEKVVYNLLSNAFKFSEDGELVVFIAIYQEEELRIEVSDSGPGIAEDKLPFIFDRFYQIDGSFTKDREGSGIGLSLSKDLIKVMDGTITVSSEEGKGTYFTVQIPMVKIKMPQSKTDTIEANIQDNDIINLPFDFPQANGSHLPKVLVIEDNQDMRQHIKKQLFPIYQIKEAKNGEEGLQLANTDSFDLIITDLMMPKIDGMELAKKLKTNFDTSHIPIIMLTALAGEENVIEGLETGSDAYLTKPFSAKELLSRTKNLIEWNNAKFLHCSNFYN